MGVAGNGNSDMVKNVIAGVMQFIKKKQLPYINPCDGRVIRLYYLYTFWVCMFLFSTVWYSWYHKDPMICVSKFNVDMQIKPDIANLCLSYPDFKDPVDGEMKNMMFYKWIPFSMLVIAGVFYIPRKISKNWESDHAAQMIEMTYVKTSKKEPLALDALVKQLHTFKDDFNGLFHRYLMLNIISFVLNVLSMFFLDFFLQGRFITYGLTDVYNRDPEFFKDLMSRTFPPFVTCTITPFMQLVNERKEEYGCHLTLMELYEKVFFVLWWWMIFVMVANISYVLFLVCFRFMSCVQTLVLKGSKPDTQRSEEDFHYSETLAKLLKKAGVGNMYMLYRLRQFLDDATYLQLIIKLEKKYPDVQKVIPNSIELESVKTYSFSSSEEM